MRKVSDDRTSRDSSIDSNLSYTLPFSLHDGRSPAARCQIGSPYPARGVGTTRRQGKRAVQLGWHAVVKVGRIYDAWEAFAVGGVREHV